MRILLYTGKGGVGKTSVSAATALRLAERGYRTIVLSTDAAHSLADSFDQALGPEPTPIAPNLWGQEIEVLHELDQHWATLQNYMNTLLTSQGLEGVVAEEMTVIPGAEELAGLVRITQHHKSGLFDVVIVDCAPTADTLRLLSFPDAARWWLEKIFPIQRTATRFLRPIARMMTDVPLPGDDIFVSVKGLLQSIEAVHALLADPQMTSVRIVLNPEKMVIKEAQRIYTYLNLFGYSTDLVVCNRVIPDSVQDAYFDGWKVAQRHYRALVGEAFHPVPILDVPLFEQEVVGLEMLRRMAEVVYGEGDPAAQWFSGKSQTIDQVGDGYVLRLPLGFAAKDQIDVSMVGDELILQVGSYKRNIIVPRALASQQVRGAKLEDGELRITFRPHDAPAASRAR